MGERMFCAWVSEIVGGVWGRPTPVRFDFGQMQE